MKDQQEKALTFIHDAMNSEIRGEKPKKKVSNVPLALNVIEILKSDDSLYVTADSFDNVVVNSKDFVLKICDIIRDIEDQGTEYSQSLGELAISFFTLNGIIDSDNLDPEDKNINKDYVKTCLSDYKNLDILGNLYFKKEYCDFCIKKCIIALGKFKEDEEEVIFKKICHEIQDIYNNDGFRDPEYPDLVYLEAQNMIKKIEQLVINYSHKF
tara:strand:+ start:785 stop:1420 length:636 start_codon:yes stop_codon:yes gene_type:complete